MSRLTIEQSIAAVEDRHIRATLRLMHNRVEALANRIAHENRDAAKAHLAPHELARLEEIMG